MKYSLTTACVFFPIVIVSYCLIFGASVIKYADGAPIIMQKASHGSIEKTIECEACKGLVSVARDLANTGKIFLIPEVARFWCHVHYKEARQVCDGVVKLWKPMGLYLMDAVYLSPDAVCGQYLGPSCSNETIGKFDEMWDIKLPNTTKPKVHPPTPPAKGSPELSILHISDVHIDYQYKVGASADCGLPTCCRTSDGNPKSSKRKAAYWGDYNCDLPWWTFENFLKQMSQHQTFDLIYFTGDLPDHHVWKQTRQEQITLYKNFTSLIKQYFPNTLFVSAMGNHESLPVNSFPPGYIKGEQSMSWFYPKVWDFLSSWVPEDQKKNILRGGYYTTKLLDNFRIVSLNMNYGNDKNWWLLHNTTDPDGQLEWLVSVLQAAENAGEKVHILGHIPPHGVIKPYSWNYYKIIERYESTVTGQFYGHTHKDNFGVFFDIKNTTRPFGVVYITGSLKTTDNPAYRIYSVDGGYTDASYQVLDYRNYIFNLTEANLQGKEPQWFLEYQATKAYNMSYTFPQDWADLVNRFVKNDTLFQKFYSYHNKFHVTDTCTGECKRGFICDFRNARHGDKSIPC